ncbi:MAG: hypothetical protein HPY57_00005 [Ignavibacteria bacterium]|nr:hypothetical protein [Ignavibacteria bacterium]
MIQTRIKRKNINKVEPQYATKEEIALELEKTFNKDYIRIVGIIDSLIYLLVDDHYINNLMATDIISIAAHKLLDDEIHESKRRRWDKANCPDFIAFFINVCKSLVWNEYKKYCRINGIDIKNKDKEKIKMEKIIDKAMEENENNLDNTENDEDEEVLINKNNKRNIQYDFNDRKNADWSLYDSLDRLEILSEEEYEKEYKKLENKLIDSFKDDLIALEILNMILDGELRDRIIARELNIDIKIVRNTKKKISRKCIKLINKNGEMKYER